MGVGTMLAMGCASAPGHSPWGDDLVRQPTTHRASYSATPDDQKIGESMTYWAQPVVASAKGDSYDALWTACHQVAIDRLFSIDRADYRDGMLDTWPLVSAQFFEPWRMDTPTPRDVLQSSIATIRRTIRFDLKRSPSGSGYIAEPRVLVERVSILERRVTSAVQWQDVFAQIVGTGNETTDEGNPLSDGYWYAIGRDPVMERSLADQVTHAAAKLEADGLPPHLSD